MRSIVSYNSFLKYILPVAAVAFICSCSTTRKYEGLTFVRKYQKNVPFIFKNNISLHTEMASKEEIAGMESRLPSQLIDSARVRKKDVVFILHYITAPPAFDTTNVRKSADNLYSFLQNMGYYSPQVTYHYDTVSKPKRQQERVIVNYDIVSGKRTVIDTLAYLFNQPELEQIAVSTKKFADLKPGSPVTKAKINGETTRLINEFRNFGYYKIGADDIRVTGDTTIKALTTVSDDPFEQLRLLAEAAAERDKPSIRLGYQLNNPALADSFKKYHVNNIYIQPDFSPTGNYKDSTLHTVKLSQYTLEYHDKIFKNNLFQHNIYLNKGDVFRQDDYYKTINELYKLGVWESPTIDISESKDTNALDLSLRLIPLKKYAFQGDIELSFSANSNSSNLPNVATGNLFGISANLSLTDRNFGRSAVRMTNAIKAGVEVNTRRRNTGGTLVNSREVSFNNSFIFPKFIFPFRKFNQQTWAVHQTFINTNISFINRLDFYKQQVINTSYGFNFSKFPNRLWSIKLLNFDFRRLYDRSESFDNTLQEFPFLRYSFNTALVMGSSVSYTLSRNGFKNPNALNKFTFNLEESGLIWGFLRKGNQSLHDGNFFNRFLREFIKLDGEFVHTVNYVKSDLALRGFVGIGIPVGKSDTTLPFFKQYFGGGPNSMRAWPVQGIGIGGQPLAPYISNGAQFNDRTGDIKVEGNIEYRFDVAPLFSNGVMFKMALFADVGNIWNYKNTLGDHQRDVTQFHLEDFYRQLGVASGVGFRFDFNYFLIRFDMGLRFKRPDLWQDHAGWQLPHVSFSNLFGSSLENRIWRYQNFNATIGIDYPF